MSTTTTTGSPLASLTDSCDTAVCNRPPLHLDTARATPASFFKPNTLFCLVAPFPRLRRHNNKSVAGPLATIVAGLAGGSILALMLLTKFALCFAKLCCAKRNAEASVSGLSAAAAKKRVYQRINK